MPDTLMSECRTDATSRADMGQSRPRILHLGCGERWHAHCVNVDLNPRDASVLRHDVTEPLPFAAGQFDAVYHSHLLEHLLPEQALPFLAECRRVLRPGGILRVAVPDLEQIARLYLEALDQSLAGDEEWQKRYDWILLELFDQIVRDRPGGAMLDYLRQPAPPALRFALERLGVEAARIAQQPRAASHAPTWRTRLRSWLSLRHWRERCLRWLLGKEYPLLQEARFRAGGEIHRTMYDRFSLTRLLQQAGFADIAVVEPGESQIPEWADLNLERDCAGNVFKPDSLFVECRRAEGCIY